MGMAGENGAVDVDKLERYLKVLALAARLELLQQLRRPRTVEEIRLEPDPTKTTGNPERPMSRQAVAHHLDKMLQAGLVRVREGHRDGRRAMNEYVVDHGRLFAIVEELRRLSALGPHVPLDPLATVHLASVAKRDWSPGPKLVIVHGVEEGRIFPLRPSDTAPPRGWVVGRAPEAHIHLEYDPFVSQENAEVVRVGREYRLLDLRSARNGTYHNWERLPVGGEAVLEPGDVIGVGRSLLLFRET